MRRFSEVDEIHDDGNNRHLGESALLVKGETYRSSISEVMSLSYSAEMQQNDTLLFMLKNHQSKPDSSLTVKEKDIEALERLLKIHVKAMQRFTMDQRLKARHVSKAFYFMLSGQVEIFKVKDNKKYRLNALNAGESFGDRTMNLLNDKRTASVATTTDSEFLKIDKSDFFDITNIYDEKHMANRIGEISQIPLIGAAEGGFLEKIKSFCSFITFEPNEPIVLEGSSNVKVYWILKGTCKCLKVVPFMRKHLGATYESGERTVLVPYDPLLRTSALKDDDDITRQLLAINELSFGDYFPDFPAAPEDYLDHGAFDRAGYTAPIESEDPTHPNAKAAASVVAATRVEVICVNRAEFVRIAPDSVLRRLMTQDHVFKVPLSQVQDLYLSKLSWGNYRKKVSDEVTGRRRHAE
ncbi:hypothetical protein HK105_204464 [Polyrhizophydium stewartii]|uniref:Cyclic nucleotide-binding domain-containing protein n=1 Tax=Polyrhizophydium stewartii TaxID=2732419 RepID=A0ABR4N948_9FUNG